MTLPTIPWLFMNVVAVHECILQHFLGAFYDPFVVVFAVCILYIGDRSLGNVGCEGSKYGGRYQMSLLNIEEFSFLQYFAPTIT